MTWFEVLPPSSMTVLVVQLVTAWAGSATPTTVATAAVVIVRATKARRRRAEAIPIILSPLKSGVSSEFYPTPGPANTGLDR
ncbi:hypothetical protein GCM10028772_41840 [Nocardioides ultimimeridianus]